MATNMPYIASQSCQKKFPELFLRRILALKFGIINGGSALRYVLWYVSMYISSVILPFLKPRCSHYSS